ncbi:MAG: ABC transporter ATP-binding protein [candidate division Zixibacteria bacterium]|nr:ABC transporter ATP-binding protein [candidate division Zixibacteria bacterium]
MIEIIDLHKSFGKKTVLDGVNLTLRDGETVVIIGGSGTGKSVLLKHIIGLLEPDEGRIIVDGINVGAVRGEELYQLRKKFGMVFQSGALFDSLTVAGNVGLPLREHTNLKEEEILEIVREKLALVGLSGVENQKPAELSGGMRKRVALARALVAEPEVMLYDEPTTGLDPIMADVINELILDLRKRLGNTAVVVTHDMASAFKIADRICMLFKGKIIWDGSPAETRESRDPVVQQFITGTSVGPIQVV